MGRNLPHVPYQVACWILDNDTFVSITSLLLTLGGESELEWSRAADQRFPGEDGHTSVLISGHWANNKHVEEVIVCRNRNKSCR